MATTAVPGAVKANRDRLAAGCWAEHKDGSLILVNDVAAGKVMFEIYDPSGTPGTTVHAQWDEARFKTEFSYPAIGEQDWLWHDKSKFPYDRVLAGKPGDTAAGRLIRSKGLANVPAPARGVFAIAGRIIGRVQRAIDKAKSS